MSEADSRPRGDASASQSLQPIDLRQKAALLTALWEPRIVAELNDYQFKVVRVQGEFVWHDHADTDEAFLVLGGSLEIDLPDGTVTLEEGELFVVPRGVRHRPRAPADATILLVEPRGVVNTGSEGGDLTAPADAWI